MKWNQKRPRPEKETEEYDSEEEYFPEKGNQKGRRKYLWIPLIQICICAVIAVGLITGAFDHFRFLGRGRETAESAARKEETPDSRTDDGGQTEEDNGQDLSAGTDDEVIIGETYYASAQQSASDLSQESAPVSEAPVEPGIEVKSLSLTGETDWMRQGEYQKLTAVFSPENATDQTLTWRSGNESAARVYADGGVVSVGGGSVVIYATTANGITAEYPIEVSSTEKRMLLDVSHTTEYNHSVGDDWDFEYRINGTKVSKNEEMIVVRGDSVTFSTTAREKDSDPDIGTTTGTITIDDESFQYGFQVRQEVYVQENEEPNQGKEAKIIVTYLFSNETE